MAPKNAIRIRAHRVNGERKWFGECKRHKLTQTFTGYRGLGTHNGVRTQVAEHVRAHQVEDAKRAARDAARAARKAAA